LDDGYRLCIKEKNYAGPQEDRLKTANAERTIELHSSVAQLLREHIGTRKTGWVFENKKHKPLCASNLLKRVLHPILVGSEKKPGVTGTKAGEHAFRRYRDGHLRRRYLFSASKGLNPKRWAAANRSDFAEQKKENGVVDGRSEEY
jgi:hypothetical protein